MILASLANDPRADPNLVEQILTSWQLWARPNQLTPPGDWTTWLLLAGRGFGKTRTGAEFIKESVESGKYGRIALVAATAADARDVMVEGESGLLAIHSRANRPRYSKSLGRLTWPNGAIAKTYSAEEPDRLRGPQHDLAWLDELAAWQRLGTYDMLQMGLRLGHLPRQVITTTPRPIQIIRDLIAQSQIAKVPVPNPTVHVTSGSTYDNAANLAATFIDKIIRKYQGTRLGLQELYARLLDDVPGALWKRGMFDNRLPAPEDRKRVFVGVDPAASHSDESSETGIIVACQAFNGLFYVLADYSLKASPDGWATEVIKAFDAFQADRIVAETNNGGDMVEDVLRTRRRDLPIKQVKASRGKAVRAEPVAALYEQNRVFHTGIFDILEDQMCNWTPDAGRSPDRLDALVWTISAMAGYAVETHDADADLEETFTAFG